MANQNYNKTRLFDSSKYRSVKIETKDQWMDLRLGDNIYINDRWFGTKYYTTEYAGPIFKKFFISNTVLVRK